MITYLIMLVKQSLIYFPADELKRGGFLAVRSFFSISVLCFVFSPNVVCKAQNLNTESWLQMSISTSGQVRLTANGCPLISPLQCVRLPSG